MASMVKLVCRGELSGKPTRWSTWAAKVVTRADGSLVIYPFFNDGMMGFEAGAWTYRTRRGDYDFYDVDFNRRFQPRKRRSETATVH